MQVVLFICLMMMGGIGSSDWNTGDMVGTDEINDQLCNMFTVESGALLEV